MTNTYRFKHKLTGLYYIPSREIRHPTKYYVKSNLSKQGKVYFGRPSLTHVKGYYDNDGDYHDANGHFEIEVVS